MNPFLNLPDKILLEICNKIPFSDLNKFVQTNKRNYNTCKEIFNKRILEIINKGNTIIFELTTDLILIQQFYYMKRKMKEY